MYIYAHRCSLFVFCFIFYINMFLLLKHCARPAPVASARNFHPAASTPRMMILIMISNWRVAKLLGAPGRNAREPGGCQPFTNLCW